MTIKFDLYNDNKIEFETLPEFKNIIVMPAMMTNNDDVVSVSHDGNELLSTNSHATFGGAEYKLIHITSSLNLRLGSEIRITEESHDKSSGSVSAWEVDDISEDSALRIRHVWLRPGNLHHERRLRGTGDTGPG